MKKSVSDAFKRPYLGIHNWFLYLRSNKEGKGLMGIGMVISAQIVKFT